MAERLSEILLRDITDDEVLLSSYQLLVAEYGRSLVDTRDHTFIDKYRVLLRYADLLSLSVDEKHQNLAQQIVILMSQLFPQEEEVKIFKDSVYKNVSNFASVALVKQRGDAPETTDEYLRELYLEVHRRENQIPDADGSFFDAQRDVLDGLQANRYYSFSAPTSMGKTFVMLNFIKSKLKEGTNSNFAVIVPTRALLSEIANKIITDFQDYLGEGCHKVVTATTAIRTGEKCIAVLTPERLYYALLKQPELEFQYLLIDEAHKISDKDKRSVIYYKILDMLKNRADTHIYFSSPVIPNPDVYLELTDFYASSENNSAGQAFSFSPVVQNKIYLDFENKTISMIDSLSKRLIPCATIPEHLKDRMDALIAMGGDKCNLIYVSSANKAVAYAMELSKQFDSQEDSRRAYPPELDDAAKQIETKIHKDYYLATLIRSGIAYHIGALPAEIRSKIEELLRKGLIKYCFCTSTLLEGVNVPVDNLFVFDNKKGPAKLSTVDAFNLIGRAGRVALNECMTSFLCLKKYSS